MTRINKFAYLPLMHALGLENIVSPRLAAANSILRYVRQGSIMSSLSIKDVAEVLEVIAQKDTAIVEQRIEDIDFPKGALILCLVRGEEVIIPTGKHRIQVNDRVMILSVREKLTQVEQVLTAKK